MYGDSSFSRNDKVIKNQSLIYSLPSKQFGGFFMSTENCHFDEGEKLYQVLVKSDKDSSFINITTKLYDYR
jgi:ABC-type multidrug transport system permease subunit